MSQVEVTQQTQIEQGDESTEKSTVDSIDDYREDVMENYYKERLKEIKKTKEEWKGKLEIIGNDTPQEIIENSNVPIDKVYFEINKYKDNYPINFKAIREYLDDWKSRIVEINKKKEKFGIGEIIRIEKQILIVSDALKWLENYIENTNEDTEELKEKTYPKMCKVKNILINLYKCCNRSECARFLKRHKSTTKYGFKKYEETKPKKNN